MQGVDSNGVALEHSAREMFLPGRILHLVKCRTTWSSCKLKQQRFFNVFWADRRDFRDILVSPLMLTDHMPDTLLDVLRQEKGYVLELVPRRPGAPTASTGRVSRGESLDTLV